MKFWRTNSIAAENAELKRQLERAKSQIMTLMLERIQQSHEIETLKEYRGAPAKAISRLVGIGAEMANVLRPANSEIGWLDPRSLVNY
jgi:hypothetical protein